MPEKTKKTKEKKPAKKAVADQPKDDSDLGQGEKVKAPKKVAVKPVPSKIVEEPQGEEKESKFSKKTVYPSTFPKTTDKSKVKPDLKTQTHFAEPKVPQKGGRVYYFAVGRRKSAVAKVQLLKNGNGEIIVNGRDVKQYFPWNPLYEEVVAPLLAVGQKDKLDVRCIISGGGAHSQAGATRLGISRALLKLNPVFRRALKKHGFLTRDPRVKERKKYGLKRARRAPQWVKR